MSRKPKFRDVSPEAFYGEGEENKRFSSNLKIQQRTDLTVKQKSFLQLIEDDDTKIVFLYGPAGTSKTFLSVLAALQLLNKKKIGGIYYIRSVVESASKSLGFLPGEKEDKMEPYLMPLKDKLDELLLKSDITHLAKEQTIKGTPVNYLRGASINDALIIADEAQNFDKKELTTIMTRMGNGSKMIICGDPMQSDPAVNGKSGLVPFVNLFDNKESQDNGIYCVKLGTEDIVRSGILKFIIGKIESLIIGR